MLKSTVQIKISTSYANNDGITLFKISIPLDTMKLKQGKSIIDCIHPDALPDISGLT
jgi:hypothetical protein